MVEPVREVSILVDGKVFPKGRPRFGKTPDGRPVAFTDKQTAGYEKAIRQMAEIRMRGRAPMEGPVEVSILVFLAKPEGVPVALPIWRGRGKGMTKAHTDLDLDNAVKVAMDAVNRVVFKDDIQICRILARKEYAKNPSLHIRVTAID